MDGLPVMARELEVKRLFHGLHSSMVWHRRKLKQSQMTRNQTITDDPKPICTGTDSHGVWLF
jgi:hypothetical protein